jgi:hypothetical protein
MAASRFRHCSNVNKRPYAGFIKANGHNGYFKRLKKIVHFYSTRDVLSRCQSGDAGEGVSRWPAPESTTNMNTSKVGRIPGPSEVGQRPQLGGGPSSAILESLRTVKWVALSQPNMGTDATSTASSCCLKQWSWRSVDKAGHMIAVELSIKFLSCSLASGATSTHGTEPKNGSGGNIV